MMKCACQSSDAHNCWALRYHGHTGVSELTVANEGKSIYEIAPLFGVHPDTIGKIFRGETWTNPRCKLTKDQIARIRSCTDPALPLARELGLSHAQVYRIRAGTTHQGIK